MHLSVYWILIPLILILCDNKIIFWLNKTDDWLIDGVI